MESEGIHELTAAYALHALDPVEEREFEEHLRRCSRCQEELASLQETAAALAHGVPAPPPSAALRGRILHQIAEEKRRERSTVVPFRRRLAFPVAASLAAAAAAVAIGLGIWAGSLSSSLSEERAARAGEEEALAVLANADARRIPLSGAEGVLVVARTGEAALLVSGLARAPEDREYEVWVIENGSPSPAGLFSGGPSSAVALERHVPDGATVAVTLERRGGVSKPTGIPLLSAELV